MSSFLYSSLNMEIVCSILKGINLIVRELNIGNKMQTALKRSDFNDCRIISLKEISVLKRDFFENAQTKELKDFQATRN